MAESCVLDAELGFSVTPRVLERNIEVEIQAETLHYFFVFFLPNCIALHSSVS